MKVKDIIKTTAVYLNRLDVSEYLESKIQDDDQNILGEINLLKKLTNFILNELATDYIPMVASQDFNSIDGKIMFTNFEKTPLHVKNVYNQKGEKIDYSQFAEYLLTKNGKVFIEYNFLPPEYDLEDDVGYSAKDVSPRIIAYGVACEYSLIKEKFEESVMWNTRFKDSLRSLMQPKKVKIKGRNWLA